MSAAANSNKRLLHVGFFSRYDMKKMRSLLKQHRMLYTARNPDVIVCYGGDGTFLLAEQRRPCVPKLLVGRSVTNRKCNNISLAKAISLLQAAFETGLRAITEMKLQVTVVCGRQKYALPAAINEVNIRNEKQIHAVRFDVFANKRLIAKNVIGDGAVIATPFGSTAYYHSIAGKEFKQGIGIAFNNCTEHRTARIFDDSTTISIRIIRGNAFVSSDACNDLILAKSGDTIVIKKSREYAKIIVLPES